jgi:hypothetical protein
MKLPEIFSSIDATVQAEKDAELQTDLIFIGAPF